MNNKHLTFLGFLIIAGVLAVITEASVQKVSKESGLLGGSSSFLFEDFNTGIKSMPILFANREPSAARFNDLNFYRLDLKKKMRGLHRYPPQRIYPNPYFPIHRCNRACVLPLLTA